jgi:hypothetical protein
VTVVAEQATIESLLDAVTRVGFAVTETVENERGNSDGDLFSKTPQVAQDGGHKSACPGNNTAQRGFDVPDVCR